MKTSYEICQLINALHAALENEYGTDFVYRVYAKGHAIAESSANYTFRPEYYGNPPIDFTRINNDVNGNPRYVVHFLQCLPDDVKGGSMPVTDKYAYAVKLMNKIHGRKYHNKSYGGGIVFQSYSLPELEKSINDLKGGVK